MTISGYRKFLIVPIAVIAVVCMAAAALADTVYNTLDNTIDATHEQMNLVLPGSPGSTTLKIEVQGHPDHPGCNIQGGSQYIGKTVGIYGEALTIDQMGKTLSKVLGVGPVKYNAVEADVYRGFGFPGADEMGNMFQAYRDFEKEMLAARSADTARKLNPALQTFEQFVKNKKDAILPAMG